MMSYMLAEHPAVAPRLCIHPLMSSLEVSTTYGGSAYIPLPVETLIEKIP